MKCIDDIIRESAPKGVNLMNRFNKVSNNVVLPHDVKLILQDYEREESELEIDEEIEGFELGNS